MKEILNDKPMQIAVVVAIAAIIITAFITHQTTALGSVLMPGLLVRLLAMALQAPVRRHQRGDLGLHADRDPVRAHRHQLREGHLLRAHHHHKLELLVFSASFI